jgi:hypothetical protein
MGNPPATLDEAFFLQQRTEPDKKVYPMDDRQQWSSLFRQMVAQVEVEISSHCNRRCSFCSNAQVDRRINKRFMADTLYSSIVQQLGALNWNGVFSFHRYNEPLADRAYLVRRVAEARRQLPTALLRLYSNGDYLTRDYCDELYDAGVRSLIVTVYLADNARYTDAEMLTRLVERAGLLGLPFRFTFATAGEYSVAVAYRDMELVFRARDYTAGHNGQGESITFDRGGTVAAADPFERTSPCFRPFLDLQIEWDGTVMPCCNLRSDIPAHAGSVVAKLTPETDILETWAGKMFEGGRQDLLSFGPKAAPCHACSMHVLADTPANRQAVAEMAGIFAPRGAGRGV